jgi:predicted ester cyclase
MSLEENKAIVRKFFEEVWNNKNLDYIDEIYTPDFQLHALWQNMALGGSGDAQTPTAKQVIGNWHKGLPDLHMSIDDQVAEGNFVVTRHTSSGTHSDVFMGIPPTGNFAKASGITINRIENGKIAETWTAWDVIAMMQGFGVIPKGAMGGGPGGPGGPPKAGEVNV